MNKIWHQPNNLPLRATTLTLALATACGGHALPSLLTANGHVEATDVRLSTKVPGRLSSLDVREGDVVKTGQQIARVETTDLNLALQQARAERDQAGAELRLRLAGARGEDRKSTRLNSSHRIASRMPASA